MSSSEENRHGFWLLLDLAFTSLYSSTGEVQKENILKNIESCLINAKDWSFLTNIESTDFFIWLVENYSYILVTNDFNVFHRRITSSCVTLVKTLSCTPVLFNVVIQTFLQIVQKILFNFDEISSGVCTKINIFTDSSIPYGIKNDFSTIEFKQNTMKLPIINCFFEVCSHNHEVIINNGSSYMAEVIDVFLKILDVIGPDREHKIGKILFIFASKTVPHLSVKEWRVICSQLNSIPHDTDVLNAFCMLLQIFRCKTEYSKIHLVLLTSTLELINYKLATTAEDTEKWVDQSKGLMEIIPIDELKQVDMYALLYHASSKQILHELLEVYLMKSVECHVINIKNSSTKQCPYILSKEDVFWQKIFFNINVDIEKLVMTQEYESQSLKNIVNIFSIGNNIKSLASKYKCQIILYDVITEDIFKLFPGPHVQNIHEEDILCHLVKISQCCIQVLEEWNTVNLINFAVIYEFLLTPWMCSSTNTVWDGLKSLCYDGLVFLLCCTSSLKIREFNDFTLSLVEVLFEISSVEEFFLDKCFLALVISHLSDTMGREACFITYLKTFLINERVDTIIKSSIVRNIVPCLISNNCIILRGRDGVEVKCRLCDLKDERKIVQKNIFLEEYTAFVGLSFIKLLLKNGTDCSLQIKLLESIERYLAHVPELKSEEYLQELPQLITKIALNNELSIKSALTCFLYDDEQKFNLKNANIVLSKVFLMFKNKNFNSKVHLKNLLDFVIDVAYCSKTFLLLTVKVLCLVIFDCSTNKSEIESLKNQFNNLLHFYNMDEWDLLNLYEKELSELWVDIIITNIQNKTFDPEESLIYIADIFNMNVRSFLEFRSTPYMIAYTLSICNYEETNFILAYLSEILFTTVKDIILNCFVIVFPLIYFMDDDTVIANALNYIEMIAEKELATLIYYSFKDLVCYIIMNSHKPLKVYKFFQSYILEEGHPKTGGDMLFTYTQGFLTFVDAKLLSKSSSNYIIKSCLRSIPHLIKILGTSHVTRIRIKFLATLRTGLPLHYGTHPLECLEAWIYFLYSVNLSFLGPYLTTIIALLMPLFDDYPTDISKILYYLIVKKGYLYHDYLPELFFLKKSSIPLMNAVFDKIKTSTKRIDIIDGLSKTLEHIKNGAVESRIRSLEYLHHLLKLRKTDLLLIIHQSDKLPILFHEIMDCLMMNIHYGNLEVRAICASCLGEIGAINPARFSYGFSNDMLRKYVDVNTEDFAFLIIMELTKSLQKSQDSLWYNTIANSIQELLKIYFPYQKTGMLNSFLSKFPSNESNILNSMLGSKYVVNLQEPVIEKKKNDRPGPNTGKSIFDWATSWASELVALMPNDSFGKKVFMKCLPGIQIDSETMEALLPHILLQAILSCSRENAGFIATEMKLILKVQEENLLIAPHAIDLYKTSQKMTSVELLYMSVTDEKGVAVILDLIDFLFNYFSHLKISKQTENHVTTISDFLQKFPANFISLKSYTLKDYCRSLFYLERKYSSLSSVQNLSPLRNIYAKLNDADGLLGIIRTSKSIPTIEESMLNHVVCGNVQEALTVYELLVTQQKKSTECYRALIQCYLTISSPYIALKLSDSLFNQSDGFFKTSFCSELVEAACKNLMFGELDGIIESLDNEMKSNWSWSIDIGLAYSDFFNFKFDSMRLKINSIRQNISERIAAISNTTIGAYRQGYNHIVSLHILNELEMFAHLVDAIHKPNAVTVIPKLFENMNMGARLQLLPANGYCVEKVISSRLQILSMINKMDNIPPEIKPIINSELGSAYLKAAQIARKNSNLQLSLTYLALAEKYQPLGLFIEKAKLHEAKHEIDTAVYILKQGIVEYVESSNECIDASLRKLSAHAKLLIARYNEENMNVDYNEGTKSYLDAINTFPTEKNYVYLAKYLYQIHSSDPLPDRTPNKCEIQVQAIKNFGKSLLYGCKYIYQSMFCMLSLWLDYGARFKVNLDASKQIKNSMKFNEEVMTEMDNLMDEYFKIHPTYMYMAVFSQLLSRINHPLPKCQQALIQIISTVAIDYPQQAFWMLAPLWKTEDADQNKFGNMILNKIKQLEMNAKSKCLIIKFHSVFIDLVDILIKICNKKIPNDKTIVPLKSISQKLKVLLKSNASKIMIPAQMFRTIGLPKTKHFNNIEAKNRHNPFPLILSYFIDVDEEVQVLFSLQRPKKLVFRGSDGLAYPFMCKPMDDLRLDSRIMEFCSVVNMYLQRDPASCDRNLHIKTYSVVPINPVNGLIEWVPNLLGYRSVLIKMFKMKSYKLPSPVEIRNKIEASKTVEQKLKLFEEVLLPMHPSVLHKWFFHQFSSPDSWFLARKSFVRTAAVMSIVGYVVGLGDRHGENILIDAITGEIMHVDFNCLFGRGEHFQVPEIVPFRLTQNMVKAMGSTGIEGHFMKSCEITNRVIRNHSDQLLYVLKPFLYDPKHQKSVNAEVKAQSDINTINRKMSGFVLTPKRKTQALSVEGQVRCLVTEATSNVNLCQMYHGWNPFL